MNRVSKVVPALYFVAIVLIVIPVFDAATSVYPFHLANSQWRFAIIGLLSNALLLPTIGMLMAVLVAVTQEHDRTIRMLKITNWVLAVLMGLTVATFMLDTVQSKTAIRPEMLTGYYVASLTALVKLVMAVACLGLFARGCGGGQTTSRAIPFRK